jgi:HSP20 family protein
MTHVKFGNRPFEKSINTMVDELINGIPVLFNEGYNTVSKNGFVPVNILEKTNGYTVDVVAPGFEKADFQVNLDENILTISADKKEEAKNEADKQIRKEYSFKSFKRSFTIDEKIDATGIEATYVNGVLQLNLPKKAEVKEAAKTIIVK